MKTSLRLLSFLILVSCSRSVPSAVQPAGWMELPSHELCDPSGKLLVYSHHMSVEGRRTRSYTFSWSYGDRVSLWVAYPLSSWNIGAPIGRSEQWSYDPLLPDVWQSDVSSGFSRGTDGRRYDRGHLIPSASRQGSMSNNAQTYYSTNIVPQDHNFNTQLWMKLESQVRSWAAKSDTLYVLTGCLLMGSKTVRDHSSNSVSVPSAFFKALLRYDASSPGEEYSGAAFFFDHEQYSLRENYLKEPSGDMVIALADLEKLLGYSLFAGLEDAVGKSRAYSIKNQDPKLESWWWDNLDPSYWSTGL